MEDFTTFSPPKHTFIDFSKEKGLPAPMFSGFVRSSPPLNQTSFFIDSDAEEEDNASETTGASFDDVEPSPVTSSVESLSGQSQDTTSPADVSTPNSQAEDASPNLIFRLKSIKGHEEKDDRHLFRATLASTQDFDWQTYEPASATFAEPPVPEIPAQYKAEPNNEAFSGEVGGEEILGDLLGSTIDNEPQDDRSDVERWTTQQVAAWMYNSGFENSIISTFKVHDINGAILLDLAFEDLRELDVPSYGKRRQIWNEIDALRTEGSRDPLKPQTFSRDRGCNYLYTLQSPADRTRRAGLERARTTGFRRPNRPAPDQLQIPSHQPPEVPRPHRCSKGEKCPKWKQQQAVIAEIDSEHGPDTPQTGKFDFSSPGASRRASLATTLSTVIHAPLSNNVAPSSEAMKSREELVPPVPPLPAKNSPVLKPAKSVPAVSSPAPSVSQPTVDTRHIVQQYSKTNSANAPTPDSPTKWDLFPSPIPDFGLPIPPRLSSLPNSLPKLCIPPSPVPGPSSSESTIRPVDSEAPPSMGLPPLPVPDKPFARVPSPELIPAPLSPGSSSRKRSPSPNLNAIAKKPSPDPMMIPSDYHLRSPHSESDIPSILPGLFGEHDVLNLSARSRPAPLRAANSTDALPMRRQVKPLPTLKESSLASHRNTILRKPLPETPYLFPSQERSNSSIAVPAVNNEAPRSSPPSSRAGPFRSRSTSPSTTDLTAVTSPNTSRALPPTPASAPLQQTSSRTPRTPQAPTPALAPVPPTPRDTSPSLSPDAYGTDILQVGYVRQRRARLWRHEWVPIHLRLTKTQMSVHASAKPDDKPLDVIRMDEYEVAVSHEAGGSRIQTTIQKLRGGSSKSDVSIDDTFTFQLVPTQDTVEAQAHRARSGSTSSRKGSDESEKDSASGSDRSGSGSSKEDLNRGLKSYYFAVKTRDDRIEWMRQLMMARETMARARRQRATLTAPPAEQSRPVMRHGLENWI